MARLVAMFLGEGEAPRASRLGQVASEGLLLLVIAADVASTRFWKAHVDAVKRACAPALIAKQEIFGYLLNDCIEGRLLYPDDALSVGQCGDNAAAKAKAVLKVKAKRDVAEVCWRAAAANPAVLTLQPPYDLKLPPVTIGVNPFPATEMFHFYHHVIIVSKPLQSAFSLDVERCSLDGT